MAAIPARRAPRPGAGPQPAARATRRQAGRSTGRRARAAPSCSTPCWRGRIWLGLIFVLLAGIVFFNVDLLRMNREITRTADRAAAVKRENARLRTELARLGPASGSSASPSRRAWCSQRRVRCATCTPTRRVDARRAAKRIAAGEICRPAGRASVPPPEPDPVPTPATQAAPSGEPGAAGPPAAETPATTQGATPQPVQTAPETQAPAGGAVGVRLVDRRIGLLFALFLAAPGARRPRAAWLGTVQGRARWANGRPPSRSRTSTWRRAAAPSPTAAGWSWRSPRTP